MGEIGASHAFLLFGNDVDPDRRAAYEAWHAGHHVPQRLTVPGILGAIRYRGEGDGAPEYLTFYRLANAAVLASAAYRGLVDEPDEVTLAMRPAFRRPVRLVAEVRALPAVPRGFAMTAHTHAPSGLAPGAVVVTGTLAAVPEHPLSVGQARREGSLTLVFRPPGAPMAKDHESPLPGFFSELDRFGFDASG